MARKTPGKAEPVAGVVKWFDADEGWGVIEAPETPGGCFVHFSVIQMQGYRKLEPGGRVRFTFEPLSFLQDGYAYRALAVWPDGELEAVGDGGDGRGEDLAGQRQDICTAGVARLVPVCGRLPRPGLETSAEREKGTGPCISEPTPSRASCSASS